MMHLFSTIGRLMQSVVEAAQAAPPETPRGSTVTIDETLLYSDELPAEARILLDSVERGVVALRERTKQGVDAIQAELERRVDELKLDAARRTAEIQLVASQEITPLVRDVFNQLKVLQTNYAQKGQLDEALAVRHRLHILRNDLLGVKPDPGNMTDFNREDYGKSFIFEVLGSNDGNCWGTDFYTADSRLAVVAVHVGVVKLGERALVRATLIDGAERYFHGSERYGIRSLDYGNYSVGYRLERL